MMKLITDLEISAREDFVVLKKRKDYLNADYFHESTRYILRLGIFRKHLNQTRELSFSFFLSFCNQTLEGSYNQK